MFKLDKNIKKRWLSFILPNMLILLLVFGAILIGYGAVATKANDDALRSGVKDYVDILKGYSYEQLLDICEGKTHVIAVDNPQFKFGVYSQRGDGSFGFATNDSYLNRVEPTIGGKLDQIEEENIGNGKFVTYTTSINGSLGAYVKVFASADYVYASSDTMTINGVLFGIAFVVLCVLLSILLGYIEIKPITENYYKQRNFINDMSHEIRTPLAIIKGNLENVLATPDAKISVVEEDIRECVNEVDYMTNMSTGLLDIAHAENRKAKKDTVLSEAVAETVDLFGDVAAMSNKSLLARIDYCPLVVDKEKIKQLVTILLDNALKYTTDGDRINVKLKNVGGTCSLVVQDTGIGVKKDDLDKIFDRFYRGENVKEIQGTGLGLSIAKSIVDSMNGTIRATENAPCGLEITATFKVD